MGLWALLLRRWGRVQVIEMVEVMDHQLNDFWVVASLIIGAVRVGGLRSHELKMPALALL